MESKHNLKKDKQELEEYSRIEGHCDNFLPHAH